jgi:large subunit ribosomal protein L28
MAMKCDNCAKGIMYGNKVSHAKNRSKRTFKPNLHMKRITVDGKTIRAKLCTSCIGLYKKAEKLAKERKEMVSQATTAA